MFWLATYPRALKPSTKAAMFFLSSCTELTERTAMRARRPAPCTTSGHAVTAPPSSVINWRRLRSGMGSSPEPAVPAYSKLRVPRKQPQVLGVDLNCSESRDRVPGFRTPFVDPGYRYVAASPSSNATPRHREHGGAAHTFASAQAGDKAKLHWIAAGKKHNRNRH